MHLQIKFSTYFYWYNFMRNENYYRYCILELYNSFTLYVIIILKALIQKKLAWLQGRFLHQCMHAKTCFLLISNKWAEKINLGFVRQFSQSMAHVFASGSLFVALMQKNLECFWIGFLHELVHLKIKFSTYFGSFLFNEKMKIITDIEFLVNFTIRLLCTSSLSWKLLCRRS